MFRMWIKTALKNNKVTFLSENTSQNKFCTCINFILEGTKRLVFCSLTNIHWLRLRAHDLNIIDQEPFSMPLQTFPHIWLTNQFYK